MTIANADHSFQQVAGSEFERIRERITFESFKRPYAPDFYREVIRWLRATVPSPIPAKLGRLEEIASSGYLSGEIGSRRTDEGVEIERVTEYLPERFHLAPGIEIVEDITDKKKTAGVETLEGRIGLLILGDGCQAHFIDMPSGMYVEEHPHSSESLIYTVRGRWVLCSEGRRRVMKPGSVYRFAANTPTGYEVPFAQDAYLLIFKGDRLSKNEKEFVDYLRGLQQRLLKEQKEGVPYRLSDLPEDHPARRFARQVKQQRSSQ